MIGCQIQIAIQSIVPGFLNNNNKTKVSVQARFLVTLRGQTPMHVVGEVRSILINCGKPKLESYYIILHWPWGIIHHVWHPIKATYARHIALKSVIIRDWYGVNLWINCDCMSPSESSPTAHMSHFHFLKCCRLGSFSSSSKGCHYRLFHRFYWRFWNFIEGFEFFRNFSRPFLNFLTESSKTSTK